MKAIERAPTATMRELGPKLAELASMVGRRADDPELIAYVTTVLKKKVPASVTRESASVAASKLGLELLFSHDIRNDKYPRIVKNARSFVPYLSLVWVRDKLGERILGVDPGADLAAVKEALGEPDGWRAQLTTDDEKTIPYWRRLLDAGAEVFLEIEVQSSVAFEVRVDSARDLDGLDNPGGHVFLAWAAQRGLLDESRLVTHGDLLAKVKQKRALGSELARAALPRGLWDVHLRDDEDLRLHAFRFFHNLKNLWITKDLCEIFGSRKGPHGHDEPMLDDDTWANVDRAAPMLDGRFERWLSGTKAKR